MNKAIKFIVAGAIVLSVITYLLITSLSDHSMYYVEITELLEDPKKYNSKGARLSGDVIDGSIIDDALDSKLLTFQIEDELGTPMNVEYSGIVPDAFIEGATVILEGKYDPIVKVFYAKKLLAKCPSKYEAEDPAEHPENTNS